VLRADGRLDLLLDKLNILRGILGTNVAYGGPGGRRLYITEAETGTIQVADVPIDGSVMYSHRDASAP